MYLKKKVPARERVQEPEANKYKGNTIPSRTFRYLQYLTDNEAVVDHSKQLSQTPEPTFEIAQPKIMGVNNQSKKTMSVSSMASTFSNPSSQPGPVRVLNPSSQTVTYQTYESQNAYPAMNSQNAYVQNFHNQNSSQFANFISAPQNPISNLPAAYESKTQIVTTSRQVESSPVSSFTTSVVQSNPETFQTASVEEFSMPKYSNELNSSSFIKQTTSTFSTQQTTSSDSHDNLVTYKEVKKTKEETEDGVVKETVEVREVTQVKENSPIRLEVSANELAVEDFDAHEPATESFLASSMNENDFTNETNYNFNPFANYEQKGGGSDSNIQSGNYSLLLYYKIFISKVLLNLTLQKFKNFRGHLHY